MYFRVDKAFILQVVPTPIIGLEKERLPQRTSCERKNRSVFTR